MNIVIEGPDGGGKSTLAGYLLSHPSLGLTYQCSEGPPRSDEEIVARTMRYIKESELRPTLFDRHPAISQPIYASIRCTPPILSPELIAAFYAQQAIYIYCRTTHLTATHVVKEHDTKEHLADVMSRFPDLVFKYDVWAMAHAHLIYRIGDDPRPISSYILRALKEEIYGQSNHCEDPHPTR